MVIYGEAHFQPSSVDLIKSRIMVAKPSVLIHELVDDAVLTPTEVRRALVACGVGNCCDPDTNQDVFTLAARLGIGLVGCDLSEAEKLALKNEPLWKQFAVREQRMLEVMRQYQQQENVIAVVGDIHLRTERNPDLGDPSVINKAVRNGSLKATIVRTDRRFWEAK